MNVLSHVTRRCTMLNSAVTNEFDLFANMLFNVQVNNYSHVETSIFTFFMDRLRPMRIPVHSADPFASN